MNLFFLGEKNPDEEGLTRRPGRSNANFIGKWFLLPYQSFHQSHFKLLALREPAEYRQVIAGRWPHPANDQTAWIAEDWQARFKLKGNGGGDVRNI